MMKYGEIKMIRRERKNGMYTDRYTVIYENGKKVFTINGAMMKKHFEFIMAADCTAKYNKDGRHTADIFTIPAEDQTTEDQTAEDQATEESKNYYAESYNFGFIAHNSEYGAPSLLIFSSKEDREKYINKYDIYRGNVNKRVIAITAKEARKYYERTRDGVRGWKDGTEYIKHIRDNIYYSVESGDYGRTSEEFTL